MMIVSSVISLSASTLVGYDIEQVLSTKIYSLMPSDRCSPDNLKSENLTYGGLVLHAPEVDIDLSYCMFRASYAVWRVAHSARLDDATYLSEESRLIPTYYPLETWTCRSIWTKQQFTLPGFSNMKYSLKDSDFIVDGRQIKAGEQKTVTFSARFNKGGKKVGFRFAQGVDWTTPRGASIFGGIVITGEIIIGKLIASLDKTSTPWSLVMTDPLGQRTSCLFPGSDFVHDSVTYLPHFYGQCEMKSIFLFNEQQKGVIIRSTEAEYVSGQTMDGANSRVFYIEVLNTTLTVCSYRVKPTTYTGVYLVIEKIHQKIPPVDFNVDAIPNLVYGTKIEFVHVNAHLSRQRIVNFIKQEICKTRQMILNGLISLASNLDNPNLFLGSGSMVGFHAEKAGAVLYVHKCAKIGVRIADFPYCTEEVPVIMENVANTTEIRFMNPITQVVYPNYTLTACDPIAPYMYRTAEGIWMHYGSDHSVARTPESLSVFSHLDFVDSLPSLHTAGMFTYENLRKSAQARVLKYSRRTIAGREVYLGAGNKYNHPDLFHFNPDIHAELSGLPPWKYLEGLENLAASSWYWAEKATLTILTLFAILGVLIYFLKIIYSIRLITYGVSARTVVALMNLLAPFLRTMDGHRELLRLNSNRQNVPNQIILEDQPPRVIPRESLYPTERIIALQPEHSLHQTASI